MATIGSTRLIKVDKRKPHEGQKTTTPQKPKKVGRKSYNEFVVWLAQKYSRTGQRSLREVAHLLARAHLLTRTGKPYGPAAIRKMIQTRLSPE